MFQIQKIKFSEWQVPLSLPFILTYVNSLMLTLAGA